MILSRAIVRAERTTRSRANERHSIWGSMMSECVPVVQPVPLAAGIALALFATRTPGFAILRTALAATAIAASSPANALTIYYVNTTGDPGPPGSLSLRQAVALAGQNIAAAPEIRFDASLLGSTLTLAQGAITIDQLTPINAFAGTPAITISGGNTSRVFEVALATPPAGDAPVRLSNLHLTHGHSDGCGGAIHTSNSAVRLTNVVVDSSNAASGGGICLVGGASVGLVQSRVSGNSAGFGGAVYASDSLLYLQYSSISGNSAGRAGGGVYATNSTLRTLSSLISRNAVPAPAQYSYSSQGGGALVAGGYAALRSTTISGNYAYGNGSAIRFIGSPTIDLQHVTVAGNATATGGALSTSTVSVTLRDSIVANNAGGDVAGPVYASNSLIKNVAGGTVSGTGNLIGVDPLLGPLADNGGPTRSMLPGPDSPVIDAASPCSPTFLFPCKDQRGYSTLVNPDIGAVERQFPEPIVFRDGFDRE
jgi:hypothetical protein